MNVLCLMVFIYKEFSQLKGGITGGEIRYTNTASGLEKETHLNPTCNPSTIPFVNSLQLPRQRSLHVLPHLHTIAT